MLTSLMSWTGFVSSFDSELSFDCGTQWCRIMVSAHVCGCYQEFAICMCSLISSRIIRFVGVFFVNLYLYYSIT